ncbi:MAG: zinc ribbon domain-containing protein [Planctomycetes bacterium]|nr:zinc ribbon domain-containing protein [Planctomycetota bacterium]
MPTYDYRCDNCEHTMEVFQSITASVKKKCPECGKLKLKRLLGTGAGLIFKGSGFYETDYRSDSYKKGAEGEKKSTSETKTDSKKETKAETKKADRKPATKISANKEKKH